jgi:hypothetical protein
MSHLPAKWHAGTTRRLARAGQVGPGQVGQGLERICPHFKTLIARGPPQWSLVSGRPFLSRVRLGGYAVQLLQVLRRKRQLTDGQVLAQVGDRRGTRDQQDVGGAV